MTNRTVASWANPATRLWQILCGGRPESMQGAAVQGYMGGSVNISAGVHGMSEALDDLHCLAFTPRGGAGITFPLAQYLSILGHAIVTITCRGLPQDGADLQVARARLEALARAFSAGATILNDHVMEHFAVADRPANLARLAALVTNDLETFALDLRCVSDSCGHHWAYPPPVESFPTIPAPHRPRRSGHVALGGLINAEAQQTHRTSTTAAGVRAGECRQWQKADKCRFGDACIFTHAGPARKTSSGNKTKAATGGGSADSGVVAGGAA
ncbi:MAG: hypothetical protein ABJL58_01875, partial [Nitratireductor sp.]